MREIGLGVEVFPHQREEGKRRKSDRRDDVMKAILILNQKREVEVSLRDRFNY